jgi:outer membrane protein TolC
MAEASNPLLLSAKFAEQASSATVAARKGEMRPNVSLNAEAGFVGPLTPFDRDNYQRNLAAGVTVTQPLFTSDRSARGSGRRRT